MSNNFPTETEIFLLMQQQSISRESAVALLMEFDSKDVEI